MSELLSRIDFAWPWVWLLVLLPLPARYLFSRQKPLKEQVRVPFLPGLISTLRLDSQPVRSGKITTLLFWLIWLLVVCALARPELLTPPNYLHKPMRDMVLILDVSGSMEKNDLQGGETRLQAVQNSVRKFIDARHRDRIGMVIFASSAWPFAPISEDKQALQARITQLAPGMIGQQTAIGDALGVAVKLLDTGQNPDASKLAILLTDGNDTASQLAPALAAQLAASHHVQVHTIAFGDPQSQGEDKIDLPLLQEIASITGGKSWTAANSGRALDSVWQQIDAITPVEVKTIGWSWRQPLFQWPLTAALALLLLLVLSLRLREKRL